MTLLYGKPELSSKRRETQTFPSLALPQRMAQQSKPPPLRLESTAWPTTKLSSKAHDPPNHDSTPRPPPFPRSSCCTRLPEYMTRSRPPGTGEDEEGDPGQAGGAVGDASTGSAGGGPPGVGEVQPLSRAKRLHQQSIMSFWLILKKKNDLQAKAARVQELRAMLEKIR